MNLIEEIKKSAVGHITELLLGLLLLLLGAIWLATKPVIFAYVLPSLSKETLAASLAGAITLLAMETAYVFVLRRKIKKLLAAPIEKFRPRFGVLWTPDLIPHCPGCSKPLGRYARWKHHGWGFKCVGCKQIVSMADDTGRNIELAEAKQLLS